MSLRRGWKIAGVAAASLFLFTVALGILALSQKRAAELRTRDWIVGLLEQKFQSSVELADFHVQVFPRMRASGAGLFLRYWAAPGAPPLIRVESFSFDLGFLGVFHVPHRIDRIRLKRMVITIPPRELRQKYERPRQSLGIPHVIVGTIESEDMELVTMSGKPGIEPLDWEIHNLQLHQVGSAKPFRFQGTLTNAKPKGEIATAGSFGPWNGDDPGATPVSGTYSFQDADLGPFPGIAGILSSTGNYAGELDRLEVRGETDTPDFSLDNVGKPVPLHTDYAATVDGTNGDTELHPVHAILGKSEMIASGSVINVPARKGHRIILDVTAAKARIEDILQLANNSDKPFLRGPINMNAKLALPPGKEKVIDKMSLAGTFAISDGRWSSEEMREKLESFSRRAEGRPQDDGAGSAVTDLEGKFLLKDALISFSRLTFSVPGAGVDLSGTYDVHSQKIDMQGHLKMRAHLSQTVTGAKSFFLKAIDPLFSKNGAGTDLPITITGTQAKPVFAVTVFHKKFEKQMGSPGK